MAHKIFYEPQRGGLCRMHAINAYFGKALLDEKSFSQYSKDFEATIKKYHPKAYAGMTVGSAGGWDFNYFGQENVVSYIMHEHKIHLRYMPIGVPRTKSLLDNLSGDFVFVFNPGHIWGMRRVGDVWHKVDSMSGVRISNESAMFDKSVGLMVPVDMLKELKSNIGIIKTVVGRGGGVKTVVGRGGGVKTVVGSSNSNIKNVEDVKETITKIHKTRGDLGDLDAPLGCIMNILGVRYAKIRDSEKYSHIHQHMKNYYLFIDNFEKNYGVLEKKIDLLVPILKWVCSLSHL